MGKMRLKLWIAMAFILLISLAGVGAVGIVTSSMPNNRWNLDENQEKEFTFIIQNRKGSSNVDVIFWVETTHPLTVEGKTRFEKQYYVQSNSDKTIKLDFKAPDFRAEFPVSYGYQVLGSGSSSGNIMIESRTSHTFYINVGDCTSCLWEGLGIPLVYDGYQFITYRDNFRHLDDLVLEDMDENIQIEFIGEVDLSSFDEDYINISFNYIFIDTEAYENLKKEADITFRNLNYSKKPIVLKDGEICDYEMGCKDVNYNSDDGVLTFTVTNFSAYTTIPAEDEGSQEEGESSGTSGEDSSSSTAGTTGIVPEDDSSSPPPQQPLDTPETRQVNEPTDAEAFLAQQQQETETEEAAVAETPEDIEKAGARALIGALSWGALTLLGSAGLLLYANKNPMEVEKFMEEVRSHEKARL
jgi:hypothetical protein